MPEGQVTTGDWLRFGVAPAAESDDTECSQCQHGERERGRGRHGRSLCVRPVGHVVAAVRPLDARVTAEVVGLHENRREAGGAIDGVVGVDHDVIHQVLVGRAGELDGEIHPGAVVDQHAQVHPAVGCLIIPDAETTCAAVIGEAHDGVVESRTATHDAPHVGARMAVLGIGPFLRNPEGSREHRASSAGDGMLPPLRVVEGALVRGRPSAQPIVPGDTDAEDVVTSLVRPHVGEDVRIVAIRHPTRRDIGKGRHHQRRLCRQHGQRQASEAGQRGQKLSHSLLLLLNKHTPHGCVQNSIEYFVIFVNNLYSIH